MSLTGKSYDGSANDYIALERTEGGFTNVLQIIIVSQSGCCDAKSGILPILIWFVLHEYMEKDSIVLNGISGRIVEKVTIRMVDTGGVHSDYAKMKS